MLGFGTFTEHSQEIIAGSPNMICVGVIQTSSQEHRVLSAIYANKHYNNDKRIQCD